MNTVLYLLQVLGCLGIFLYGMKVLSEGIQKTAGDGMRRIMASMTRNRFSGVMTGFITTILLQSSSASTVIVVSFVNAGLLTLTESIGVIMGANLGTTTTAWIIAAVGKFSLSDWAMPIIGIGLPMLFIGKGRVKSSGEALIGFGLLFMGLGLLKDAVPDVRALLLSDDQTARETAFWWKDTIASLSGRGYLSILLFLFGGVVLTLVVQSSSAAMAITITLAVKGWIGIEESCAIVLGENIGTTITAYLASLGAGVQAKRAARAHFVFNVIGVLWMLPVFYVFLAGVQWLGASLPDSLRVGNMSEIGDLGQIAWDLAIFHSLFNFSNICILVGFVPLIERIVTRWVKDEPTSVEGRARLPFISQRMVDVGELNLPEAEKALRSLGDITLDMFQRYREKILPGLGDVAQELAVLKREENDTDALQHDLTEYLVRCSASELSPENAAAVSSMLRISAELEEAADCIFRAGKIGERRINAPAVPAPEMNEKLLALATETTEFLNLARAAITNPVDDSVLQRGRAIEEDSDRLRTAIGELAMRQIQDKGSIQLEMLHIDTASELEKISNHLLNTLQAAHERGRA
jgi:phosphate:Na+ symporter